MTEGAGDAGAREAFPWPPPAQSSPIEAFARTWQDSMFSPARFFQEMPPITLRAALLYAVICEVVTEAVQLFWRSVLPGAALLRGLPLREQIRHPLQMMMGWGTTSLHDFLLSPLTSVLDVVVEAAFIQVFALIFIREPVPFSRTLTAIGLTMGALFFSIIPVVGVPLMYVWGFVVTAIAIREINHTTTARAVSTAFAPYGCMLLLGLIVAIVVGATVGPRLFETLTSQ